MNKLEKSRKKKTTRREFLTTAGVLAAGTMVAGNVLAGELKKTLAAPKVAKKADPKLTLKEALRTAGVRANAKLNYKVRTPLGRNLTIREIYQNKESVEKEIKNLADIIVGQIDKGRYTGPDLYVGMDMLHGAMDFNIFSAFKFDDIGLPAGHGTDMCGNDCYGPGGDNRGYGCGGGCPGDMGLDCGGNCDGKEGQNCGNECPGKPDGMVSSVNPFIRFFIDNVHGYSNILSPGTSVIFQRYSHDILGKVLGQTQIRDPRF